MRRTATTRRQRASSAWALGALTVALTVVGGGTSEFATADVIVVIPGCVVDPSDIIGWWPGEDDLQAAIGPDLVGPAGFGNALFGRGFSLDSTHDLSAAGADVVSTGLTVETWMKPTDPASGRMQALVTRWDFPSVDDTSRSYALLLDPFANLVFMTDETSTRRPEEVRASVPQVYDGEFHHVAATWTQQTITLYLDGFPVGSAPSQGGLLNPATSTPIRIGSKSGIGDAFRFAGSIDEPSVIRRALTAAEIESLVGAGPNGKCVFATSTGLVGPGLPVPGDAGGVDPVISDDGRYVLFRTRSTDMLPIVNDPVLQTPGVDLDLFDNSRDDLVLLDNKGSSATTDDTLELISVDSNELGGRLDSAFANMTANASHVVFASISNDLVVGDTLAGRDVFIRNRVNGTTQRVSVRSDGSQPQYTVTGLNNDSRDPSVSANGTVVAFVSTNRDLVPEAFPVPGDTWQQYDVYVRDVSDPNPANHVTERITTGIGGVKASGSSITPIVSPDGRYVWFSSAAANLTPGDTNGVVDVFVHDRQTDTTSRLDLTTATGLPLDADAYVADVSPDGRWVAFSSSSTTIVAGDANGQFDAFRFDAQTSTVAIASPALAPLANGASFAATVSDDGRYVTFESQASNLVPGDTNGTTDVFISDMASRSTQRLSLDGAGDPRLGASADASATADARSVVYRYQAPGSGVFTIWRAELALS